MRVPIREGGVRKGRCVMATNGVVPCHRSKCMFCKEGVVYDINVERIIGHYWCAIDAYSPGVNCTPDGCYYYRKGE